MVKKKGHRLQCCGVLHAPWTPYLRVQVTVITSDVRFAGTTADVFAEVEGEVGSFGPEALENASRNFERGRRDDFLLRATDIGSIKKVRIWHANNTLTGSDWHLQVKHCTVAV